MTFFKPSVWGRPATSTALALLLAVPSHAAPFPAKLASHAGSPVVKVQAQSNDSEAGAEALRKKLREKKQEEKDNAAGKGQGAKGNAAPEAPPAQAEQTPQPAEQPQAQPEQQASPAAPKAAEPAPPPEPKAEAAPQPEKTPPGPPVGKKQAQEKKGEQQNAVQARGRKHQEIPQGQGETSAPEPKRVTAPEPEPVAPPAQQTETTPQPAPQTVAPAQGGSQKPERKKGQDQQQKAAQPEMPAPKTVTVPRKQETAPAAESGAATAPQAAEPQQPSQSAGEKLRRDLRQKLRQQTQQEKQQAEQPAAETAPKGELAPLTDSAKEATGPEPAARQKPGRQKPGTSETQQTQTAPEQVITPQTMPKTDAAAQEPAIANQQIQSIQAESGTAVRSDTRPRRQFDDRNVVGRFGDRIVIRLDNGRLSIYSGDDRDRRLRRDARNVQVEQLRGGRLRETIYLRDGSRIVTIYNRDGDVLRRSRFLPDGREIVLVYVARDRWDDLRDPYYDPGRYLPPLVLTIPRSDYIFEREGASADDYYRFLRQPPVEPVPRLYSIDEVTRSARIRDMARRVDLVSVHFEFGSADISESEVDELQTLAEAMNRLLDENPGEMFLIEGHTDAVGSEEANLVLSDRRAESVAEVLTDYFGIPPENMVTHGYGERYLKINTQAPERENRRVAIRRITPLVAPANEQVLK